MKKVELLAPAGSLGALKAAVNCGADACYFGGQNFNARAYAKNLTDDEIKEAIEYAHLRDVKVYAAVNTMIMQEEMDKALEYIDFLHREGTDAIIVADIGLARACRQEFPNLALHASTQMCIHNAEGIDAAKKLGLKRVVLSREVPLEELISLSGRGIETEVFIHGAMCSSVSGLCIMSGLIGDRSGNRGACAQPCRMEYTIGQKKAYHLSMADLCTVDMVQRLVYSGVTSLKIEGRMKRDEYVAVAVSAYRRALDAAEDPRMLKDSLKRIFNRGGFTHGYLEECEVTNIYRQNHMGVYIGKVERIRAGKAYVRASEPILKGDGIAFVGDEPHGGFTLPYADKADEYYIIPAGDAKFGDSVYKTTDTVQLKKAHDMMQNDTYVKKVQAKLILKEGDKPALEIKCGDLFVKCIGEEPLEAANAELSTEKVCGYLQKTGGTIFEIEKADIVTEGNPFISAAYINSLRRTALDELRIKILDSRKPAYERVKPGENEKIKRPDKMMLAASVRSIEQAYAAINAGADLVYLAPEWYTQRFFEQILNIDTKNLMLTVPAFMLKEDWDIFMSRIENTKIGVLVGNISQIEWFAKQGRKIHADIWMNVANSETATALSKMGADMAAVSVEINKKAIADIDGIAKQAVVYGKMPMMNLVHCPVKKQFAKCVCDKAVMKDRKGQEYTFERQQVKHCIVRPLSGVMAETDIELLKNAGVACIRMDFRGEATDEIERITAEYRAAIDKGTKPDIAAAQLYRGVQ